MPPPLWQEACPLCWNLGHCYPALPIKLQVEEAELSFD